jgi:hypothetical protein
MVARLARLVKVTVSGPSGVLTWPMASAHRCRLPSARRRVPRQADRVGIGPVAAGLAAVIGCYGVRPAVVSRRRAGDRCCG